MRFAESSLFDLAPDYSSVYRHLSNLREEFHRSGKLDDSNAKLDEVVKLFATYLAYRVGSLQTFPGSDAVAFSMKALQQAFLSASALPQYKRSDGLSIFGEHPRLALGPEDINLSRRLVSLSQEAVDEAFRHFGEGRSYDVLNEAFGHFVRDNFRGNIEDAQFLTPAEVVDFIVKLALIELKASDRLNSDSPVLVADPCSGVGSFLTSFSSHYASLSSPKPDLLLFGQDKVERMVRLTTINLSLHSSVMHSTFIGNSLYRDSPLDAYNGKMDVVLTNPPFGARFAHGDVHRYCGCNTPFFSQPLKLRGPIDSELLFIDRDLALLRTGGLLAIIVPDSVISAKGTPALLRNYLAHEVTVRAVVELPNVAFAQAGTRTKTAVLLLQKGREADSMVFMGKSNSLGFQVTSRKGVLVKVNEGFNDLDRLSERYSELRNKEFVGQDRDIPSQIVPASKLRDVWTPGHYLDRDPGVSSGTRVKLSTMVKLVGDGRKPRRYTPGDTYISVLHVIGDGLLDLQGASTYAPKTPGIPVKPGEILFSRINPRIPRVLVVPPLAGPILCSSEFEVMIPNAGVDAYLICFLLLSPEVQQEIVCKTSGTSASHNRIKTRELGEISLPSLDSQTSDRTARLYRTASTQIFGAMKVILQLRAGVSSSSKSPCTKVIDQVSIQGSPPDS